MKLRADSIKLFAMVCRFVGFYVCFVFSVFFSTKFFFSFFCCFLLLLSFFQLENTTKVDAMFVDVHSCIALCVYGKFN